MAKFLNTSATNYFLEELIKNAKERLILISPFLKLNDRIKELLEDKNRLKIDVRIVYGKVELQPEEINWLKELEYVRTSFCKNLHAKCYLNERMCIITSLNLYEFSQVNNNEMGILVEREHDHGLYVDAYDEAQRIIRVSDEVRMSLEKIVKTADASDANSSDDDADAESEAASDAEPVYAKLTTSRLAKKLKMQTRVLIEKLVNSGYLELRDGKTFITDKGKAVGGEFRMGSKYGPYFLWPEDLSV